MPPPLALLLTLALCVYLLRRYSREWPPPSAALWLPVIWIFFVGSRFPSQWFYLLGLNIGGGGTLEDGSPLDAVFFSALILAGIIVLSRRGIGVASLARDNVWLTVFFVYCFFAIFWSDFPFVAFKRWIKVLGHPVMALIILSDPSPVAAFRLVMKRCGTVILSLSVVFIKYFPQFGRGFNQWSGLAENNGMNLTKNELGCNCLVFGIFFLWNFLLARRIEDRKARREEILLSLVFFAMVFWLLQMAHSATSLVALLIGTAVITGLGFRWVSKRYFGTCVVAALVLGAAAQLTVGLYAPTLKMLGRNATLTDRTEVWADTLALDDSPILGTGFESFWLGKRLDILWAKWWWHPNEAHNGYIETYLSLGAVGLLLLIVLIVSAFRRISARFGDDFDIARLHMGFLFAIVIYNFTEATFKGLALLYTLFLIIALNVPHWRPVSTDIVSAKEPG